MNNQDKGLKRDTIDKFYTKEVVVENCVNLIKSNIDINSNPALISGVNTNAKISKSVEINSSFFI